jgi:hypothetical protein
MKWTITLATLANPGFRPMRPVSRLAATRQQTLELVSGDSPVAAAVREVS